MEIIIRSVENGWQTERKLELPEDDGLVKSILRSVKRRVNPPQPAERNENQEGKPEEAVQTKEATPEVERTTFETGHRGFLILTCEECGRTHTINAREPVKNTVCKTCGHVTELKELAAVEMCCPDCGKTWTYKTNSEQAEVKTRCIQCGTPMESEWDSKTRRYLPKKKGLGEIQK